MKSIEEWGKTKDGQTISRYTIMNETGSYAVISNYGAVLHQLWVPDKDGKLADVVLGFEDPESYFINNPAFGSVVGPYANRIEAGQFSINGKTYQLEKNEGNNTLHSGPSPFFRRLWEVTDYDGTSVTLLVKNADGECGFPGNVELSVTYALSNDNTLSISYSAHSDQDTALNVTNHSYFNLSGHDSGLILDEIAWIDSDAITATDEASVPHGELFSVDGTAMDFRTPKALGRDINDTSCDPIRIGGGYDHNYVLDTRPGEVKLVASLEDHASGRKMEVYTDMPGIQLYTGNFIEPDPVGKGGIHYQKRSGVAFETQYYPNAINVPSFPQPLLKAGKTWESTTAYKFSTL